MTTLSQDGGGASAVTVEEALKQALDHAAEAIHWVAADGTILWANQTELDLLGYTASEYIGRHIGDFHLDRLCIEDILARLTRGETLHHHPARLRHKDGSVRDVQINSKVLWEGETFVRTQCFTRDVSRQKFADDAARRLAEIVEHSDDAIISQDLSGTIVSWNSAAERLYGYSKVEALGRPISALIPDDRAHEEARGVASIKRGERVASFDTVRRHKNGVLIPVSLTMSPIRDAEGRIIGASKTARDISERKRIEARDRFLVDLDDAVRPLSDPSAITYTAAKALGTHLAANRCAYATVEDDQDTFELTGNFNDGVETIVGRYTFRQFGEECLRLMRAGEPYVVSNSATDPRLDEHDRASYVLTAITGVICVPVMKQGQFVAAMAVHTKAPRDWQPEEVALVQRVANRCWESIERTKVTQSLRASEARFRAVASTNSSLTLYEQDLDLRYTWIFPSHPEFSSDSVGKTDSELLPLVEGAQLSALKRQVLSSGVGVRTETTVTLPNEVRTYDLVIEPRHDADGNMIGVGGVAVDVSERKRNELLLARAQQTAAESEARLREADRRKDEFLAMLAHELRNPLAPIRTGLQLIRLGGDTPAAVEQVRTMMERQLTHIVRLVDDLLDVSRITAGKIHLQREHVPLRQLIDGAIEVNRAAIENAGVAVTVDLPDEDCTLLVDPTRMGQVIANVLNNAVKFSRTGGRIDVTAGAIEASPADVMVTISDDGDGISAEILPSIFELFVQADHRSSRNHGGLGIGLALARTLVEMHGGTIDARSDGPGRGSAFTIRIPAAPLLVTGPARSTTATASRATTGRVLVVDDNVDSAEVLVLLVRRLGGEARAAFDGESALLAAAEFTPDIVLLDIGLPGIDGYETCRRLRAQHGGPLKIVALTGWGQDEDRRRATAAGFDAHLTKPADPSALELLLADTPRRGSAPERRLRQRTGC